MASIFTRIIRRELPAFWIYEDDLVIAILAKDQVQLGHTLVIPKLEVDHWIELPERDFLHLQKVARIIGQVIHKVTECRRVLTATIGYEVSHFHLHLIPSWTMADLNFSRAKSYPREQMEEMANKLRQSITGPQGLSFY